MSYQDDLLTLGQREASMLSEQEIHARVESTMSKTFAWMAGLLLISFGVARGISTGVLPIPFTMGTYAISAIGGFVLILIMSFRWQRMSYQSLSALLILFALLEGYGLTGVFMAYGLGSVQQVFLTTSILFAALAFAGNYLKIDIMKVGSILMIALVSLIIGMIINMFRGNAQFDIWLSIIGVVIFSGFIVYDINVLKQQALFNDDRITLLMALTLFINFINLFLFLLRIFGRRD